MAVRKLGILVAGSAATRSTHKEDLMSLDLDKRALLRLTAAAAAAGAAALVGCGRKEEAPAASAPAPAPAPAAEPLKAA